MGFTRTGVQQQRVDRSWKRAHHEAVDEALDRGGRGKRTSLESWTSCRALFAESSLLPPGLELSQQVNALPPCLLLSPSLPRRSSPAPPSTSPLEPTPPLHLPPSPNRVLAIPTPPTPARSRRVSPSPLRHQLLHLHLQAVRLPHLSPPHPLTRAQSRRPLHVPMPCMEDPERSWSRR